MIAMKSQMPLFREPDTLNAYRTFIGLPSNLAKEIRLLKEEFRKTYGPFASERTTPHITICSFLLLEHRTFDVFTLIQRRLEHLPAFDFVIDGFGFDDLNKQIYLRIKESEVFTFMSEEFERTRQQLHIKNNYQGSSEARITIAKGLTREFYEDAKSKYAERTFDETFTVDKLWVVSLDQDKGLYTPFTNIKLKG